MAARKTRCAGRRWQELDDLSSRMHGEVYARTRGIADPDRARRIAAEVYNAYLAERERLAEGQSRQRGQTS